MKGALWLGSLRLAGFDVHVLAVFVEHLRRLSANKRRAWSSLLRFRRGDEFDAYHEGLKLLRGTRYLAYLAEGNEVNAQHEGLKLLRHAHSLRRLQGETMKHCEKLACWE
eukprot:1039052-Pelagomonas_calceolata.AAC.1